ncbi:hypothetical protein [uncultured Tenacibaculum sp.]|uniref:hypothetical protein n=1 Tax=uncultured Tenacibaculum sp. TaxID=174713 RepID=UPI002609E3C3|nr:hypothetical protein [uncultured Tenacibaculum sp.]
MNKTPFFVIGIITLILISCKSEPIKYSEIENSTEFKKGEWISNKDSLSGISIRKGILAFFENMKFPGDSIYDYKVVDSIKLTGYRKEKIGTYIKKMNLWDTIYVEVTEFTDSTLTLKMNNGMETYNLK